MIVLLPPYGYPVAGIADLVGYDPRAVRRWIERYNRQGIKGLKDRPRVGTPGMSSTEARLAIMHWLRRRGVGRRGTRYRLHDWLISRQRYWGPPIPIVYCERCGTVPVPERGLPVLLPAGKEFRPTGTGLSSLASVPEFVRGTCPGCGGPGRMETDVSDNFLDSAWYFLRYPSSQETDRPWAPERTRAWLPVDLYAGGQEHVMRHHLYARFLTRALHDLGLIPFAEPFPRLRLHGLLTQEGAKDEQVPRQCRQPRRLRRPRGR